MTWKISVIFLLCTNICLYGNPTANSLQMIVALADNWTSTTGYLQCYERTSLNDSWQTVGEKVPVSFGKNGLGWGIGLHNKYITPSPNDPYVIEGSRKSPVGAFALNIAFGKADRSDEDTKNIKLMYIHITEHTWGVDDVKSKYYNRIEDDELVVKNWNSAENMKHYADEGLYEFGILIEHNYDNPIPGKGSCFFIHVHRKPGSATFGCTALSREQIKELIYWLDPIKKPILIQFPLAIFNELKNDWALPTDSISLSIKPIDNSISKRIAGKSWETSCPITLEDLCYLTIPYWGYDDKAHLGEMIVHKNVAQEVVDIFQELYETKFPIERISLIDDYYIPGRTKGEVDDASMAANNSSGFFFRYIGKTTIVSEHGLGTAIDINPRVNPFVRGNYVCPSASKEYCDRTRKDIKGLLTEDSVCVKAFKKRGWNWGGNWKKVQDYQHFCKIQTESLQ